MKPNPGSDEAIGMGCTCPVLDNGHGAGCGWSIEGRPVFWIEPGCPVHCSGDPDMDTEEDTDGHSV